jgi:hypothetical protein
LELGLAEAVVENGELRLDEHVENRSALFDDLADAETERDVVGIVLEVKDPQRSRAEIRAFAWASASVSYADTGPATSTRIEATAIRK